MARYRVSQNILYSNALYTWTQWTMLFEVYTIYTKMDACSWMVSLICLLALPPTSTHANLTETTTRGQAACHYIILCTTHMKIRCGSYCTLTHAHTQLLHIIPYNIWARIPNLGNTVLNLCCQPEGNRCIFATLSKSSTLYLLACTVGGAGGQVRFAVPSPLPQEKI